MFADFLTGGFGLWLFPIANIRIDSGIRLTHTFAAGTDLSIGPYLAFEWALPFAMRSLFPRSSSRPSSWRAFASPGTWTSPSTTSPAAPSERASARSRYSDRPFLSASPPSLPPYRAVPTSTEVGRLRSKGFSDRSETLGRRTHAS